jgi:hypothetical protein
LSVSLFSLSSLGSSFVDPGGIASDFSLRDNVQRLGDVVDEWENPSFPDLEKASTARG